ncbi:ATP-binding cassette domain-containing protein, partial [Pseudactinotalea sp.]|uniref:ATP-binding cassette domain-containing protein n=1 Tax=Pseudactinotalea sp. TaxID=1926260 RepID=UPI003B3AA46F
MREAARGVAFVVGTNWRVARAAFAVAAVLTGLLACVPALQVFVIAELVTALGADSTTMRDILVPLLAVALIIGLNGPVRAAVEVLRQQADDVGAATTTAALTRRAARTSPRDLARPEVVAELERHAESIWQVVNAIPVLTFWAAQHVISTIGVIVAVAVFSPLAALLTAISLIPALLGGRWLAQRLEAFWDRVGKLFARERYLTNLLVRQRSAAELAVLGAGTGVARQAGDYWLRYIAERRRLRGAQLRIEWLVGTVATLSVLGALVALLLDVDLSPTAVAGVTGVIAAAGSVAAAGSDLGSLLSFGPQAAKLRDFLGRAPKTVERATSVPVTKVAEIRLAEMSHTYTDRDAPALVDVSFEARRGEMIALVGANGAGKTTAVRALLGLIEPDNGLVEADGVRPADVGDRAWLDRFGVLVQEYERYELTVRQNLLLGNDDEIGDEQLW